MSPLGIQGHQPVAWNSEHVQDIRARNPSLTTTAFTLPKNSQRPFPIVGTTLVGPDDGAPYTSGEGGNRNLSMLEMTPLYVGTLLSGIFLI
jgi:hypothetical protein